MEDPSPFLAVLLDTRSYEAQVLELTNDLLENDLDQQIIQDASELGLNTDENTSKSPEPPPSCNTSSTISTDPGSSSSRESQDTIATSAPSVPSRQASLTPPESSTPRAMSRDMPEPLSKRKNRPRNISIPAPKSPSFKPPSSWSKHLDSLWTPSLKASFFSKLGSNSGSKSARPTTSHFGNGSQSTDASDIRSPISDHFSMPSKRPATAKGHGRSKSEVTALSSKPQVPNKGLPNKGLPPLNTKQPFQRSRSEKSTPLSSPRVNTSASVTDSLPEMPADAPPLPLKNLKKASSCRGPLLGLKIWTLPSDHSDNLDRAMMFADFRSMRALQQSERDRFIKFHTTQMHTLKERHRRDRDGMISRHRNKLTGAIESHPHELAALEDRHVTAEMELAEEQEQESRNCELALRHMEGYCRGHDPEGTGRTVTLQDRVKLERQYWLMKNLERRQEMDTNVMREQQAREMKTRTVRQVTRLSEIQEAHFQEVAELDSVQHAEAEEFRKVFDERKKRICKRWGLAVEIWKCLREKEGKIPEVPWPIPLLEWPQS